MTSCCLYLWREEERGEEEAWGCASEAPRPRRIPSYRHWKSSGGPASPLEYSSSQPGDIEPQMHEPSSFEMPRQIGLSSMPEAIA